MSEAPSGTISVNGKVVPLRAADVAALLGFLGYDADARGVAVAVNGTVVRRREWAARRLEPGDVVEIVGAVQGG